MREVINNISSPVSLLRYLRVYLGLTQQKLGDFCGLSPNDVSRFERGFRGMGIGRVLRLADYLGVTVDDLAYDRFANAIKTLHPCPTRNEEAQKRQKKVRILKDQLGRDGEAYVARLEREKLNGTAYANGVNEAFADDLTAGFDNMSFTPGGQPLFIEVKTTGGEAGEMFYLTDNEKAFMEHCAQNGYRYELHRVFHFNNGRAGRVVYTAEEMMGFHYEPSVYIVRRAA